MNAPARFHVLAPLPPAAGWDRALALDRQGGVPRPVVLSFVPAAVTDDPERLTALSRDAEAAARVSDAHLVQLLGLEAVGERLALVERHRPGTTLRALLDEAGRLPADLAVRAVVDACAGLAALHALDAGDGVPVAHGGVSPERLAVGEDGVTRLSGLAVHGGREPLADVRALAAVLHEALTGDPPPPVPRRLEVPGVPEALAAVLDLALGAADGAGFPSAASLGEALAAALPPAPGGALAAYAEAVAPPPATAPAATEAVPEVSAELLAPGASAAAQDAPAAAAPVPAPAAPLAAAPPAAAPAEPAPGPAPVAVAPSPDAAVTFPVPAPARPRSAAPALAAIVMAAVGFALGHVAWTHLQPAARPRPTEVAAAPAPAREPAPAPAPAAPPTLPAPTPAPVAAAPSPPPPAPAAAVAAAKPAPAPSLALTTVPAVELLVGGKRLGRTPVTVPLARGEHDVRLVDAGEGIDVTRKVNVRGPATPVRIELGRGALDVTAPAEAEVRVDGRFAGKGNVKLQLWEGRHRIEVRLGQAKVQERFEVAPGETWTYNVTPTP